MSIKCRHCNAFHWIAERVAASRIGTPAFTTCCKQGDVVLEHLKDPPEYLQYLLSSMDSTAKAFRNNIRKYNSALAFTSVKYTVDGRATGGIQCFQIHGELFHLQGPLQPQDLASAQFAQLYFYDPELATNIQVGHYNGILEASILQRLTEELIAINPFIGIYKTAKEQLDAESDAD